MPTSISRRETAIGNVLTGGQFDTIFGKVGFGGKANYGIDNQIQVRNPIGRIKGGKIEQVTWLEPAY